MVREEIKEFEELLKNKLIRDAGDWIKYTYNFNYYCSGNPKNNHQRNEQVIRKKYRELVIEEFQGIANKFNLKFDMEFTDEKVTRIKWYQGDKWIRPINGVIEPIFPENNLTKRNPIPAVLRHEVFLRDGYRCVECGATNKEVRLEADHIIPVAQGGTDELDNLQTLCRDCNRGKSYRTWRGPGV